MATNAPEPAGRSQIVSNVAGLVKFVLPIQERHVQCESIRCVWQPRKIPQNLLSSRDAAG